MTNLPSPQLAASQCPSCDSTKIEATWEKTSFPYGTDNPPLMLEVEIPVTHCRECNDSFTGEQAADIQHAAICKHLGLLSPEEIRHIRETYGMSQEELSKIGGFGRASLARWETGALLPNRSSSALLYLLSFPENMKRMRK